MPLRLNSSSLTCSICALAAIVLQLVAMECQKLQMVDSPILSLKDFSLLCSKVLQKLLLTKWYIALWFWIPIMCFTGMTFEIRTLRKAAHVFDSPTVVSRVLQSYFFSNFILFSRHYPIGVLFDLFASNESLPWNITLHFKVSFTPSVCWQS